MAVDMRDANVHLTHYQNFIQPYHIVAERICRRLLVFQNAMEMAPGHNPIHAVSSRIKTLKSIEEKLERTGREVSFESAKANLNDIAGIRVVCYFLDDLIAVIKEIRKFEDCVIVKERDYTQAGAKASGYRSYHIILHVPLDTSKNRNCYPVEIQLRTLAMDFWASIEHELRYKNRDFDQVQVANELKAISDILNDIDTRVAWFYDQQMERKALQVRVEEA